MHLANLRSVGLLPLVATLSACTAILGDFSSGPAGDGSVTDSAAPRDSGADSKADGQPKADAPSGADTGHHDGLAPGDSPTTTDGPGPADSGKDGPVNTDGPVQVDGGNDGPVTTDGPVQVDSGNDGPVQVDGGKDGTVNTDGPVQVDSGNDGPVQVDGGKDGTVNTDGPVQVDSGNDGPVTTDGPVQVDSGKDVSTDAPISCSDGGTACGGHCTDTTIDPTSCGYCGHDCLGGACNGGTCEPVLVAPDSLAAGVIDMASDGHAILWSDWSGNIREVESIEAGTRDAALVLATGVTPPAQHIGALPTATGGGYFVWVTPDGDNASQGFGKIGIGDSGTAVGGFATGVLSNIVMDSTKASSGTFYVQTAWNPVEAGVGGIEVLKCAVQTMCTYLTGADGGVGASSIGFGTVGSAEWVAWGDTDTATLIEERSDGKLRYTIPIGAAAGTPFYVASDDSNVYWLVDNAIYSLPLGKNDAAPTTPIWTGVQNAPFLSDGTNLYFLDSGGNLIAGPVEGYQMHESVTLDTGNAGKLLSHLTLARGGIYYEVWTDSAIPPGIYRVATP